MQVANLGPSALTDGQLDALAACLPSLQCGPRTEENFDQLWFKDDLYVYKLYTISQIDLIPTLAKWRRRPQQPLLGRPVPLEQIDIPTLANTQNHFNYMEFEGRKFVRVTSSVHSIHGQQSQSTWRVSDYDLEGQRILSVFFTLIVDEEISSSGERPQEESWTTT